MVFVIIVTANSNYTIIRHICRSSNQPFHVVSLAPVRGMGAWRFGETVNGGLQGDPLFGEEVDAVVRDDERLTVEVGVSGGGGKVGLILVEEPYSIYFRGIFQKGFLADSQDVEILSVTTVVTHVAEVKVLVVLVNIFGVPVSDSLDAEGLLGGRIGAVYFV